MMKIVDIKTGGCSKNGNNREIYCFRYLQSKRLKFVETGFMAFYIVNFWKCSMCTGKECLFLDCWL